MAKIKASAQASCSRISVHIVLDDALFGARRREGAGEAARAIPDFLFGHKYFLNRRRRFAEIAFNDFVCQRFGIAAAAGAADDCHQFHAVLSLRLFVFSAPLCKPRLNEFHDALMLLPCPGL